MGAWRPIPAGSPGSQADKPSLGATPGAWQGEPLGKTGEETQAKVVLSENSLSGSNLIQTTEDSITTRKTGLE